MRLIIRASDEAYREHIQDEENAGRLPLAWLTFGNINGHGWGFLQPWAQQTIFPAKGSPRGIGHPDRQHEPFWILRLLPLNGVGKHKNQDYLIEGRYWFGLAWRKNWGKRWGIWKARGCCLDPDIIRYDPGQSEDWGEGAGED